MKGRYKQHLSGELLDLMIVSMLEAEPGDYSHISYWPGMIINCISEAEHGDYPHIRS
jgi:hypothetical protein